MSTEKQREVYGVWEALDDDISTERLMQMVADTCKCDVGYVAEALFVVGVERGVVTQTKGS